MKTQRTTIRQLASVICVLLPTIFTGCISQQTAARSAKGKLLQEAERYATGLKSQDKLPGYGSNEHGRLVASAHWDGGDVSYPASVRVRAWKEGDETTYCYTLVKETPQSAWELTSATHLGKHNKIIAQLPPN